MKRSEMVEIIDNAITDVQDPNRTLPEYILDRIEAEGMLPPKYKAGGWGLEARGWEPEDEGK